MKTPLLFATLAISMAASTAAFAFQPTLKNEDSKSYKYEVRCGGGSTHSSISGNTTTTLSAGNGNCTLKVEGAGEAKLVADQKCLIKNGSLKCS